MAHYFDKNPEVKSNKKDIKFNFLGAEIYFRTDNGVFSKDSVDEGTRIFLDVIVPLKLQGNVLDLGCGYGALGLTLAYFNKDLRVLCADVNARAVELCQENAKKLQLHDRVDCLISDRYENIGETFDYIVINPPIRAGKAITYSMYEGALDHLKENGSMFIVIRKAQGAASALEYLESIFSSVSVLEKHHGYWIIQAVKNNEK